VRAECEIVPPDPRQRGARTGGDDGHDWLSYQRCYRDVMAQREKRSISLPPDLAAEIDRAAASEGTTFSAWIATTAAHRLRLDAGRRGIAAWERQHGALTAEELADGLAQARAMLSREGSKRKAS
jgi:hypothetical protein